MGNNSKLKEGITSRTSRSQELNHSTNEFTIGKSNHKGEIMQSMNQNKTKTKQKQKQKQRIT